MALTAVHAALQEDAELAWAKLRLQGAIVAARGQQQCSSAASESLVRALTGNSVLQVQRQQLLQEQHVQQSGLTPHAQAVSSASQQWLEGLMQDRLHAAQKLLPDIPLVAAPRMQDDCGSRLEPSEPPGSEAWRDIGARHSPWVPGSDDAASACAQLMYAADDLLQALTTPVAVAPCTVVGCPHCDSAASSSSSGGGLDRRQDHDRSSQGPASQQPKQLTLLQSVHAPNRVWLQSFFAELQPDRRQVGLDDVLHPWYSRQQTQQARRTAASCSAAACRAAARTGVPAGERPWVWATALGLPACPSPGCSCSCQQVGAGCPTGEVCHSCGKRPQQQRLQSLDGQEGGWRQLPSARDVQKLQMLCTAVKQQALLLDVVTCADVQQVAASGHFFVFEEAMRAVLLAFSRDASVLHSAAVPLSPLVAAKPAPTEAHLLQLYPTSGVVPFQGLCAYLAPLCYLYSSPTAIYPVWHAMYCQYWCRLHTLGAGRAPAAGLPVLCRTFLDLLQEVDPAVHQHMASLSTTPLDLVFPWLLSAFATHLAPSETLLLWDRIIGFDSLLPLPVLAVAVLVFRRDLVLAAETSEELAELLQDLSQLRVVPLLQSLLFDA